MCLPRTDSFRLVMDDWWFDIHLRMRKKTPYYLPDYEARNRRPNRGLKIHQAFLAREHKVVCGETRAQRIA